MKNLHKFILLFLLIFSVQASATPLYKSVTATAYSYDPTVHKIVSVTAVSDTNVTLMNHSDMNTSFDSVSRVADLYFNNTYSVKIDTNDSKSWWVNFDDKKLYNVNRINSSFTTGIR